MSLGNYRKCEKCGDWEFANIHKCLPLWDAIVPEFDDEILRTSSGHGAGDAAENLLERNFAEWDHPGEMEIWVRKREDSEWQKFNVTVQAVPEFSASEIL